MTAEDRPQITLITPPALDLDVFPDTLARVLDSVEIACLRLSLASRDEDEILRAAMPAVSLLMSAMWQLSLKTMS